MIALLMKLNTFLHIFFFIFCLIIIYAAIASYKKTKKILLVILSLSFTILAIFHFLRFVPIIKMSGATHLGFDSIIKGGSWLLIILFLYKEMIATTMYKIKTSTKSKWIPVIIVTAVVTVFVAINIFNYFALIHYILKMFSKEEIHQFMHLLSMVSFNDVVALFLLGVFTYFLTYKIGMKRAFIFIALSFILIASTQFLKPIFFMFFHPTKEHLSYEQIRNIHLMHLIIIFSFKLGGYFLSFFAIKSVGEK